MKFQSERMDLACAFRWTARLGLNEAVVNHFSLSVNGGGYFLINPAGRHFSRMRASELLVVDAEDPDTMNRQDAPDRTAWSVHGAIHRAAAAGCVLHVHPPYATVLTGLCDSRVLPVDQATARFYDRVAVDTEYGGLLTGCDEGGRLVGALRGRPILMMGNHGVLVTAPTVAQAFDELYYLERAAFTLVTAYSTGRPLRILPDAVARRTAQQFQEDPTIPFQHFQELRAILDEGDPSYKL